MPSYTHDVGRSTPVHTRDRHPPPIHSLLKNYGKKKLLYDPNGLTCDFCGQKGHTFSFCNGRDSEPTVDQFCPWTQALLDSPRTELSEYSGLSLKEAMTKFLELGDSLNKDNPYAFTNDPVFALRANAGYWKALGTIKQPLSWICYGVPDRYICEPPHFEHPNWANIDEVLQDNPNWLDNFLDTELQVGHLLEVDESFPSLIHPIGVTKRLRPDGSVKFRKLDDTRVANAYKASMAHKFETIFSLPSLLQPGDKVWWLDLTDFYYQIPLHPDALPYACFTYKKRYFCSRVLLMGQKPATFWVSKITRPVVAFLRALGIRVTNYIDDWFGAGKAEFANEEREFVFAVLKRLGFKINYNKSANGVHDEGVHLGFLVDAKLERITLTEDKRTKTSFNVEQLVSDHHTYGFTTHETLRSVVGQCSSLSAACPQINVFLRSAYKYMDPHAYELAHVRLSRDCLDDLLDCSDYILNCKGAYFSDVIPDGTLQLDAGETGYGGTYSTVSPNRLYNYAFPLESSLVGSNSTKRELLCVEKIFALIGPSAKNSTVELLLDSAASVRILLKGGSKHLDLNEHARHILDLALHFIIRLLPKWINRELNKVADRLSKIWADFHLEAVSPWTTLLASMRFGNLPITCLKVGSLPHFFRRRERFKKLRTPLLLLHPRWEGQIWWPQLLSQRVDFLDVGSFEHVYSQLSEGLRNCHPKPSWLFQLSLLH